MTYDEIVAASEGHEFILTRSAMILILVNWPFARTDEQRGRLAALAGHYHGKSCTRRDLDDILERIEDDILHDHFWVTP